MKLFCKHCWHTVPDSHRKLPLKEEDRPSCERIKYAEIDMYKRINLKGLYDLLLYSIQEECCHCSKKRTKIMKTHIGALTGYDYTTPYLAYPTGDEY